MTICALKSYQLALTGVVQWVEIHPANRELTGLTPSQGTCPGRMPDAADECFSPTSMLVSLSLPLPSPLSKINK